MDIRLNNFRQASGGFLQRELKLDQGNGAILQSSQCRLVSRLNGWINSKLLGQQQPVVQRAQARAEVKQQFLCLLRRSEGDKRAMDALEACGLPSNWAVNDRPLTNHQVRKIFDKAQEFRQGSVRHNDRMLSNALAKLPGAENRDLRAAISRALKTDSRYGSQKLDEDDLRTLCEHAKAELHAVRRQQCLERFPALSQVVLDAPENSPLRRMDLNPATLINDLLNVSQSMGLLSPELSRAFQHMDQTSELLGRQAWNTDKLRTLSMGLKQQVQGLEAAATELCCVAQSPEPPKQLRDALCVDISRQVELLQAKSAYVDELSLIDPLTDRSVKHSNLVWAYAGQSLLAQLDDMVSEGHVRLNDQQRAVLADVWHGWANVCHTYNQHYELTSQDLDALQAIPAPRKDNRDAHPIVQGKRDTLQKLRSLLEHADIPKDVLETLFSKKSLVRAERTALSGIHTWQSLRRDIPVMRDGVMRTYRSEITPAHLFDRRLGIDIAGARSGGVSSGFKDSEDHARSLKVSRLLDQSGRVMTTVVGHGVLDMWAIQDEALRRQASQRGAKEVLELALSNNSRLMARLTGPEQAASKQSPRLVHVSVNLISPDSVRERLPGMKDYKEKTYTFNQFQAFEDNSGPGRTLRLLGENHQNGADTVRVDVDVITFSFGINAIATGTAQHFLFGAWSNVHEHNTRNMVKLVGDLGEGRFGAVGTLPGGFIGEVHDRLQDLQHAPLTAASTRQKAADLMAQLRGQTDLVRTMFTQHAFRVGKGDTAKMGREILVLQGLAEQGLDLVGATDLAGTMSKGCKSDKDRGGVTDVELKTKLILRDLGGDMEPDERLEGDDQGVYYTVSAGSGQLENQRWNTGLAGSKEVRHLKARLPDPEVRQFLCGLGKFTKA